MFIIIISILAISSVFAGLLYFLCKKQSKFVEGLKIGDKISYDTCNGVIINKIDENKFIIQIEVSGMKLSTPIK